MVIQLSKWTPRLRMVSAGWTSASPRTKVLPSSRCLRLVVVHHINSDLDGLSLRRLDVIHSDMCSIHSRTLCFSSAVYGGSQKKKRCVFFYKRGGGGDVFFFNFSHR